MSGLRRRAPALQMIHDHLSGVFEHSCTTLESLLEGDALTGKSIACGGGLNGRTDCTAHIGLDACFRLDPPMGAE